MYKSRVRQTRNSNATRLGSLAVLHIHVVAAAMAINRFVVTHP